MPFTFLSFTSNMAASGLRGILIDMLKKKQVDVLVTSSGSFDEDLIRSKLPYLQGDFEANNKQLGEQGINRMGNVFVPNDRYGFLADELKEVLATLYQKKKQYTVRELLREVGLHWKYKESIVVQAAENDIPIFCPGITDGSFGLQLSFFQQQHPDFSVDTLADCNAILSLAATAKKKAGIMLGGGIAKHHAIMANLLAGGLDYAIYINSSTPFRGSLSNATTSEAQSWGKVSADAKSITLHGDAAFLLPLLVLGAENMNPHFATPHRFGALPDELADYKTSKVVIFPVPYDQTTTYNPGARNGPRAIIHASRFLELFDEEAKMNYSEQGICTLDELEIIDESERLQERITEAIQALLEDKKHIATIGGRAQH